MQKISEERIRFLNRKFLNKTISVIGDSGKFVGTCTFIGYNNIIKSFGFQVTLDRMPISNVNVESIQLYEIQR